MENKELSTEQKELSTEQKELKKQVALVKELLIKAKAEIDKGNKFWEQREAQDGKRKSQARKK